MIVVVVVSIVIVWLSSFASRGVAALPEGFVEEGVARVFGISTIAFLPQEKGGGGGRTMMYAATKEGVVRFLPDPDNSGASRVVLDITSKVCSNGERGMHQVLVHPGFFSEGKRIVYVSYTYNKSGDCLNGAVNRLSRFAVNDNYSIDKRSEEVFLETNRIPKNLHNGGDLLFGNDGYLYLTLGDGGRREYANDRSNLHGTIVRLTEDGGIPPDNPFLGDGTARCNVRPQSPKICQEIFAYGFRNPYRFAKNPNTKDGSTHFYIGDVGGKAWEEISEGGTDFAGKYYGYPEREGPCSRDSFTDCNEPLFDDWVDPVFWYEHVDGQGAAVTGVEVVPEHVWPIEYNNAVLYLDFVQGKLHVIRNDRAGCRTCSPRPIPGWTSELFHDLADSNVWRGVQLVFGPYKDKQALYYTTRVGRENIRRITYEGGLNRAPTARITVAYNQVTFQVGTFIEFDGSTSSDPDGHELEYLWDFGDGNTSRESDPSHAYASPGNFEVQLTVTDSGGFSGTAHTVVDVGAPPIPTILSPGPSATFAVGQVYTLVGSAVDGYGNPIDDMSLLWEVRQHHSTHYHPFLDETVGNYITIDPAPSPEDHLAATNSYLEVRLTATDSNGFSATTSIHVMPRLVLLSFDTDPSGLELLLDGYLVKTPELVTTWANHPLQVEANDQDSLYFKQWSDDGTAKHTITTLEPSNSTATPGTVPHYVATFDSCRPFLKECQSNTDCCSGYCQSKDHICTYQRQRKQPKWWRWWRGRGLQF